MPNYNQSVQKACSLFPQTKKKEKFLSLSNSFGARFFCHYYARRNNYHKIYVVSFWKKKIPNKSISVDWIESIMYYLESINRKCLKKLLKLTGNFENKPLKQSKTNSRNVWFWGFHINFTPLLDPRHSSSIVRGAVSPILAPLQLLHKYQSFAVDWPRKHLWELNDKWNHWSEPKLDLTAKFNFWLPNRKFSTSTKFRVQTQPKLKTVD